MPGRPRARLADPGGRRGDRAVAAELLGLRQGKRRLHPGRRRKQRRPRRIKQPEGEGKEEVLEEAARGERQEAAQRTEE